MHSVHNCPEAGMSRMTSFFDRIVALSSSKLSTSRAAIQRKEAAAFYYNSLHMEVCSRFATKTCNIILKRRAITLLHELLSTGIGFGLDKECGELTSVQLLNQYP